MAKKRKLLDQMRDNPRGDWSLGDVKTLAKQEGLELRSPSRGSHYVISSPHLRDSVTVPHNRPIKTIYIKFLTDYTLAHRDALKGKGKAT